LPDTLGQPRNALVERDERPGSGKISRRLLAVGAILAALFCIALGLLYLSS
jgi:hypothetical protein